MDLFEQTRAALQTARAKADTRDQIAAAVATTKQAAEDEYIGKCRAADAQLDAAQADYQQAAEILKGLQAELAAVIGPVTDPRVRMSR